MIDVRLLGGLEVVRDRRVIPLRGQRAPAALAVLALHPGQPVTTSQLIQALWGAQAPRAARESVHVFIHQLRKALGADQITTQNASYRLEVDPEQVDVIRFQRVAERARTARDRGALQEAWELFGQALGVWRGMALADFDEPFAATERAKLEDRRLVAVEEQLWVGLELGRHADLAGELDALTAQHPRREGLWELLLLARYRTGRQAEALEAFQAARRALLSQSGQPLGARLEELQRAILVQDPSLEPRTADHLRTDTTDPRRPPRPQPNAEAVAPRPAPIARPPESATPAQGDLRATRPAPKRPTARSPEERKLVTALVLSLTRKDPDAENDPEEVNARTTRLLGRMTERVGHYGGTVHAVVGGRLLAIFGAERSHTDDPERAVRAALEILEGLQHTDRGGLAVLRAGVATGEVVVTYGDRGDGGRMSVVGDALNAATGLESQAAAGAVVVGSGTYLTTRRVIDYRPLEQTSALEQALGSMAWQALAPRGRTGARLTDRAAAPLVERDRELGMLTDVFGRFLRDRQPQVLTLISEAGMGKSRLVGELGRLIDQAPELIGWRVGYTRPYDQGALGALVEVVKAQVGILDGDDTSTADRKLQQAAADAVGEDAEPVTESLRALLGAAAVKHPSGHRRRLVADWTRFVAAVAAQRPLVVVFEDLQWADDALLEFTDGLPERVGPVPLLVVCTARPEFLDRRDGWGGGQRNTVTLSLSPLTEAGVSTLLDNLLPGQERLPAPTRASLLAASGGNPLYVEEYARMSAEQPTAADADLPMPTSVQQVIAARIDALPPEDKRLLQDFAVIGETGWVGALAAMTGQDRDEVQAGLQRLQRHEFLRRVRASSVAGETEYAFRHALIREVAYGQLLRAERSARHERIAGWVEALGAETGVVVELLAHHYTSALDLTRAASQPDQPLTERARHVFRTAGDRAGSLGANAAATRAYQAALELWPAEDPDRPELLLRLGQALMLSAHTGEDVLGRARQAAVGLGREDLAAEADMLLSHLARVQGDMATAQERTMRWLDGPPTGQHPSPSVLAALGNRAIELETTSRYAEAIAAARQLVAYARRLGLPADEGHGLHLAGEARILSGDLDGWAEVEQGLALMDAHRSWRRVFARFGHTHALWWYGDLERCAAALASGLEVAGRQDAAVVSWLQAVGAALDYAAGRWGAVEATTDRLLAEHAKGRKGRIVPLSLVLRSRIRLAAGQPDRAEADARAAFEAADAADVRYRQAALAIQGRCLLAAGRRDAAAACLEDLLDDQRKRPAESCATPDEAALLLDLGHPPAALPDGLPPTRWHHAVQTLVSRDFHRAAQLLTAIGSTADAAQATARCGPADAPWIRGLPGQI